MNCDEIVSGLILEFRRGTLIMVVLAQLNKPMYGYSLVKELEGKGISIEGNTLYQNTFSDRKSTRLNSSHITRSRMPSSA